MSSQEAFYAPKTNDNLRGYIYTAREDKKLNEIEKTNNA